MIARIREAPVDRFKAQLDEILSQLDRLPDAAVRAMLADLETARRDVIREILGAGNATPGELDALKTRIDDVMQRFADRYQVTLSPFQADVAQLGSTLVAEPLILGGAALFTPQISRRQLEVARNFQALLISNLADDATNQISQDLALAILRGSSVFEAAQIVAGSLTDAATFGTIASRAEAITRTELGRIQSVATQGSLRDLQAQVPDLQKQWLHSGAIGRYVRTGHLAANGQVRDVAEPFDVAETRGGVEEAMLYPRDPSASPQNTINCRCTSVPYRAAWAAELGAAA
jgi:F like protein